MNPKKSKTFTTNVNDLLEVQRSSFYRFLYSGISKELNAALINPFFFVSFEKTNSFEKNQASDLNFNFVNTLANRAQSKNFSEKDKNNLSEVLDSENSESVAADMYLYPSKIKLKGPLKSLSTCFDREETYAANVYVLGEIIQNVAKDTPFFSRLLSKKKLKNFVKGVLKYKFSSELNAFQKTKISIKKYFYLATIPFLTEDGSFFVNGCERVVVNQIVRSPGIYFRKEYLSFQKTAYTATFISDNWVWTKFTLDNTLSRVEDLNRITDENIKNLDSLANKLQNIPKKYDIYLNLNDSNFWKEITISKNDSNELLLIDLILCLGFTLEEILDNLKYSEKISIPEFLKESKLLNNLKTNQDRESNLIDDSSDDNSDDEQNQNIMQILLEHIFGENDEKAYFSVGELGRYRINKRLGLSLPLSAKYLTGLDFLKIIDSLIQFREENMPSDDIDDLKNKQIKGVGELIQNQLRLALFRCYPKYSKNVDDTLSIVRPTYLLNELNTFFLKKKKDQLLVNSFLISEQLRIFIKKSLREFFLTSQLSQYFDETNPLAEIAHKRRISVFGQNGLQRDKVSTKIRDIHPSQYGKICPIETPEGENAGLVMSLASFARVSQHGWLESPYFLVENGKILSRTKSFYLNPHQEENYKLTFANNLVDRKGLISSPYVTSKEGFYFSESEPKDIDFNLISQLQILSIGSILVPFVEHNDANRALMGSNMQRQALPLFLSQAPLIGTGFEVNVALESGLILKSESEGNITFVSSSIIEVSDLAGQKLKYKLKKYQRSNQETCNNQVSFYWPGEKVCCGQILADCSSTVNGELSLGTNLFIGYLPWEGYNYEDAIVINENLIKQNILTSLHICTYETTVKPAKISLKKINYLLKGIRKIRELKKNFKKLAKLKILAKKKIKIWYFLKGISSKINNTQARITKYFAYNPSIIEQSINKEKLSNYATKANLYLKRNLSSNGIVKLGAYVENGDILVSKVQIKTDSEQKPSYQKLFEDLQLNSVKIENETNENRNQEKSLYFAAKGSKLIETLRLFKNLNKTYFKILVLLERLHYIKNFLTYFLASSDFTNNSEKKEIYLKSLRLKYLTKKNYLFFLIKNISVERKKKENLGPLFLKLFKLLIKKFYKHSYKFFYNLNFKNNRKISEKISKSFNLKRKKIKAKVRHTDLILKKLYQQIKQKTSSNFKLFAAHFFEHIEANLYPLPGFASEVPSKNLYFNKNSSLKAIEHFLFLQLNFLNTLDKQKQTLLKTLKLESSENVSYKDTSLIMPLGSQGRVIDIKIIPSAADDFSLFAEGFLLKIYVLESRKITIGDKLSGRHGNKGVISRVLPPKDMPILPDGTPLDLLVNPLGVPSRMNVGQLLECLLGLASFYLGKRFKVKPFDEIFGNEASRVLATQKLKEAALVAKKPWLYNDEHCGKFYLRDGRTGEFFDNPVTVGVAYILKLIHLVQDKVHSRALGPYNKVTEQPLQGKSANGGQRFGEMEVWALEAYGCAHTLQELLTVKSDDIDGRNDLYKAISSSNYYGKPNPNFSETLACLIRELNSLGLDFQIFKAFSDKNIFANFRKNVVEDKQEINIFNLLEERLKLRFKSDQLTLKSSDFQSTHRKLSSLSGRKFEKQKMLLFDSLEKV